MVGSFPYAAHDVAGLGGVKSGGNGATSTQAVPWDRSGRHRMSVHVSSPPKNFLQQIAAKRAWCPTMSRAPDQRDVAKDGIALYQSDDSVLHTPKPKTPNDALKMAREYFDEWFGSSLGFYEQATYALGKGRNKIAAFEMHQATERLYHCALLVCTFYTPHVHNLGFLRSQANLIDRRLMYVWPEDNRKQRAMFEKLKQAYVKARYSKHYRISEEELTWLGEQVEELGRVIHAVCSERIAELEAAAKG